MIDVVLRAGRERSVERRHPWVMSGSVEHAGSAPPGAMVRVLSAAKKTLGFGHYSPASQIRVRMMSFGAATPPPDLLARRVERALARRGADPMLAGTNAVRLVNAEGDDLPGLVVDRFDDTAVVKLTSAGMIAHRTEIARALAAAGAARVGLERSDETAARREGFEGYRPETDVMWGESVPELVAIDERGRRFWVDVRLGQKTGFYLDQRDARDLAQSLARGRAVLDLYSHTGGFAIAAARGGARRITAVESSRDALTLAAKNLELNGVELESELVQGDVHRFLREHEPTYGLIVVDPPPLAKTKRDVDRAARAYKDAILYALRRAEPDAFVLVFSCSHHVGLELFQQIVFGASLDAGRSLQICRILGQPSDHPVSIDHPEGAYLTGILLRVAA